MENVKDAQIVARPHYLNINSGTKSSKKIGSSDPKTHKDNESLNFIACQWAVHVKLM